jgi:hypothetical protein
MCGLKLLFDSAVNKNAGATKVGASTLLSEQ